MDDLSIVRNRWRAVDRTPPPPRSHPIPGGVGGERGGAWTIRDDPKGGGSTSPEDREMVVTLAAGVCGRCHYDHAAYIRAHEVTHAKLSPDTDAARGGDLPPWLLHGVEEVRVAWTLTRLGMGGRRHRCQRPDRLPDLTQPTPDAMLWVLATTYTGAEDWLPDDGWPRTFLAAVHTLAAAIFGAPEGGGPVPSWADALDLARQLWDLISGGGDPSGGDPEDADAEDGGDPIGGGGLCECGHPKAAHHFALVRCDASGCGCAVNLEEGDGGDPEDDGGGDPDGDDFDLPPLVDAPTPPRSELWTPRDEYGRIDLDPIEPVVRIDRNELYGADILVNAARMLGKRRSRDESEMAWGRMPIRQPTLTASSRLIVGKKRRPRSRTEGDIPTAMHRMLIDGAAWRGQRGTRGGGSVLIDASGSMSLDDDEMMMLLAAAEGLTVAAYGSGYEGAALVILAAAGKAVETIPSYEVLPRGGNLVDGPALAWLLARPGPRLWVSDAYVTQSEGGCDEHTEYLTHKGLRECVELCRAGEVSVCGTVEEASMLLRIIHEGGGL